MVSRGLRGTSQHYDIEGFNGTLPALNKYRTVGPEIVLLMPVQAWYSASLIVQLLYSINKEIIEYMILLIMYSVLGR